MAWRLPREGGEIGAPSQSLIPRAFLRVAHKKAIC